MRKMRKVLRFCRVVNFTTLPTLVLTFSAMLPGDINDFGAVLVMILYMMAAFFAHHSWWSGVKTCYLKTIGYKLRDAKLSGRLNIFLLFVVNATMVFSRMFFKNTVVDFVISSILLLVNLASLLVLVGFIVVVRLGHKFGKIPYVEPYEWCTPTTVYRDGKAFTVLSGWEIPEE